MSDEELLVTFFQDAAGYPPLSAAEEGKLHLLIAQARTARGELLLRVKSVSDETLQARVTAGEDALGRLVRSYLKLSAEECLAEHGRGGVSSLLDLVQVGNLALVEAAGAYDPSADGPFAAFATVRIREAVGAAGAMRRRDQ